MKIRCNDCGLYLRERDGPPDKLWHLCRECAEWRRLDMLEYMRQREIERALMEQRAKLLDE